MQIFNSSVVSQTAVGTLPASTSSSSSSSSPSSSLPFHQTLPAHVAACTLSSRKRKLEELSTHESLALPSLHDTLKGISERIPHTTTTTTMTSPGSPPPQGPDLKMEKEVEKGEESDHSTGTKARKGRRGKIPHYHHWHKQRKRERDVWVIDYEEEKKERRVERIIDSNCKLLLCTGRIPSDKSKLVCWHCGETESPEWRRGPGTNYPPSLTLFCLWEWRVFFFFFFWRDCSVRVCFASSLHLISLTYSCCV